jgi:hypothetical protein
VEGGGMAWRNPLPDSIRNPARDKPDYHVLILSASIAPIAFATGLPGLIQR